MNDQAIQAAFLQQLPEDVRQLERAWNALHTSSAWGEADRAGMIQATHRLAGVALTVGYSRIGHAARQVETYLHRPNFGDRCTCQQLVADLFTAIETRAYDGASAQARQVGQALKNVSSLHEARSSSLIYLIDDDPLLIDTLAAQMRYFGYSIQTFTRLDALHAALQHTLPAAILMDILFPKGELAGSESIQMLQGAYHQQLPVFFSRRVTMSPPGYTRSGLAASTTL
ncbi:MAG: Hpt domain-containing protein [Chloroflexales bacterium]